MKVAQYDVLGNNAKRDVRPARDDRSVLAPRPLVCGFTGVSTRRSSRPGRPVFFERHPSTSYWATFFGSHRDRLPLGARPCPYVASIRISTAFSPSASQICGSGSSALSSHFETGNPILKSVLVLSPKWQRT
jgi:hypothetical protein